MYIYTFIEWAYWAYSTKFDKQKVAKWTYWALQFLKYTLTDKIATGKYYTAIFISHLQHELLQKDQVHIYTIKSAVYTKIYNTQDINFQL